MHLPLILHKVQPGMHRSTTGPVSTPKFKEGLKIVEEHARCVLMPVKGLIDFAPSGEDCFIHEDEVAVRYPLPVVSFPKACRDTLRQIPFPTRDPEVLTLVFVMLRLLDTCCGYLRLRRGHTVFRYNDLRTRASLAKFEAKGECLLGESKTWEAEKPYLDDLHASAEYAYRECLLFVVDRLLRLPLRREEAVFDSRGLSHARGKTLSLFKHGYQAMPPGLGEVLSDLKPDRFVKYALERIGPVQPEAQTVFAVSLLERTLIAGKTRAQKAQLERLEAKLAAGLPTPVSAQELHENRVLRVKKED